MPRNMSFSLTTNQIRLRYKTVTRRMGWWGLKPGDEINAIEKGMGLKKGEKVHTICRLRVVSTSPVLLGDIDAEELRREGFPGFTPEKFVALFRGATPETVVNRIEFDYIDA